MPSILKTKYLLILIAINSFQTIIAQTPTKLQKLTNEELKTWWQKDLVADTVPGISLEKAYNELLQNKAGDPVIVAIIDTRLDRKHVDLINNVWINPEEIPENGIDDDQNGYIDDIYGWNFLGNQNGKNFFNSNYESIRIIRAYSEKFENKTESQIPKNAIKEYLNYKKALIIREKEEKKHIADLEYGEFLTNTYPKSKDTLHKIFGHQEYTISQLDSLYQRHEKDSILKPLIYFMRDYKKYNLSQKWIKDKNDNIHLKNNTSNSFDYNERQDIDDNATNVKGKTYGNNEISNDTVSFHHAIGVAGVLAAEKNNDKGINGFSNQIKIMSLCVASDSGDEHDKDIALAIQYAADNGAKIINMSFGKPLSLHRNWVDDAIRYAASKNVLIVCSAGNNNSEIALDNRHYPNDYLDNGEEIVSNLIKVGASTHNVSKALKSSFSNYSKEHVDIFAPGSKIYTLKQDNDYKTGRGTSYSAPIVTGVAALIRSHYPTITATQIKQILMDSSTKYNVEVEIKQEDASIKLVPFSELSRAGGIVNAYNALLLADKYSKK